MRLPKASIRTVLTLRKIDLMGGVARYSDIKDFWEQSGKKPHGSIWKDMERGGLVVNVDYGRYAISAKGKALLDAVAEIWSGQ